MNYNIDIFFMLNKFLRVILLQVWIIINNISSKKIKKKMVIISYKLKKKT